MTWIIIITVLGAILKFLMSPPSALVGWMLSKFELHPKLNPENITVTLNGNPLEGEEKIGFTNYLNEAHFLERDHIYPGNEELFLHPETDVIPFVVNVTNRKREMNLFVYCYDHQVDVVKQWKKKVASYSLRSESLQTFTTSNSTNKMA
ncbi:YfmQ family protein [Oceanobacillus caeni]|uniref:Uncharacterized protein n=1 Tax=Oceanobacillus caeni TaxID=405946 RepID=A0ABR5MJL8_9BACI|nr:YfmQ family protein [Oceanobacillus caeni]KPH74997.1 hypothetical protein AFL42_09385 [Oceanobacillus caeni]